MARPIGVGPLRRLLLPALLAPAFLAGPVQLAGAEAQPRLSSLATAPEAAVLVVEPPPPPLGVGAAHVFTVRGKNKDTDVDVTGKVRLWIKPDGRCDGLTCTPDLPGEHTVWAALKTNPDVVGSADIDVVGVDLIELEPANEEVDAGDLQPYEVRGFRFGSGEPGGAGEKEYVGDVTARTDLSIGGGSGLGRCDRVRHACGSRRPGEYVVRGRLQVGREVRDGRATLRVEPGPLDRIDLKPSTATILAGTTQRYTAFGYDRFDNPLGYVTRRTILDIEPGGWCDVGACSAEKAGTYTVTGTGVGVSRPGRARLTVVAGTAAGLVLEPGKAGIVAGGEQPYRVFARDRYDNRVGEMTDQAVFSMPEPGRCEGATCTSTVPRAYEVKATVERDDAPALVARGRLRVVADRMASLRLEPKSEEIMAGARRRYTAYGLDRLGNPLGDVTDLTTFSIRPSGRCVADSCGADRIGDYVVIGRHPGTGATGRAPLAVRPATLARLVLDPRGRTVAAGVGQSFRARGLDAFGNEVGDVTADSVFDIAPSGSCVRASCSATEAGDYTVTARRIGTRVQGTAVLHVDVGPLARIVLEPATSRVTVGASVPFQVRGFDAAGNPRGDATRRTVLSIDNGGSCSGVTCTPTEPETHVVFGTVPGTPLRAEAVLVADRKKPASLRLDPSVATVTVGSTQPYRVEALDDRGASLGDVTDAVRLSIDAGGSCGRAGCGARRPDTYRVTATLPGVSPGDPAVLHVRAGLPATLELEPRTATVTAGSARAFRAFGYDALGNFLGDVTRQTIFTIGRDGSCDGASCTAAGAGPHEVTGRMVVGWARGTAELTAVPVTQPPPTSSPPSTSSPSTSSPPTSPPPSTSSSPPSPPPPPARVVRIGVQPATGQIAAGAWFAFGVRAEDASGRDLGDLTAEATMVVRPDGSCTGGRCTAERAGIHQVLVTARGMQAAASLEVVAAQELAEVLLDPQVSSVRTGAAQPYRAWGFDAYGNNLGEVTDRTTFSVQTVGSCPAGNCAVGRPGTYRVRGAVGGTALVGEAQLEVIEVSAAKLVLAPVAGSVRAGSALAFRAHGYDDLGNDVGDLTATTRLSMSSGGRCSPSGCTADRPGRYTVTATTPAGAGGSELTAAASLQVTAIGPADLPVPIWLIGVAAVVIGVVGGVILYWFFPGTEPLPADPVQDGEDQRDRRDDRPGEHVDFTVRPTLGSPQIRTQQRRWQRPSLTIRVEPHADPDGVQTMREDP